ncbi:MAG: tRNA (adenosine(37)-N6)-threonylcarbamoyltransferase complex ATPase subunit type 1 TsaE [Candidatus Staskawiczbacteria bacterium]|nr:tRNA (adenosine(37)-N6)-threonylcarbamoyltransferase complex ATPase subunit type 1 TsaE [Candidatus Staskawiczbacteria bacterium]
MLRKYITTNYKQTQKLGKEVAEEILKMPAQKTAVVLGLQGNLGGGKTTFLQGFAKGLGIKEKILSPTFVIMKKFTLSYDRVPRRMTGQVPKYKYLYHIDCYRLKSEEDILELGFDEIISDPKNIVAVEWPERIKKVLPQNTIFIDFRFIDAKTREISFKTSG